MSQSPLSPTLPSHSPKRINHFLHWLHSVFHSKMDQHQINFLHDLLFLGLGYDLESLYLLVESVFFFDTDTSEDQLFENIADSSILHEFLWTPMYKLIGTKHYPPCILWKRPPFGFSFQNSDQTLLLKSILSCAPLLRNQKEWTYITHLEKKSNPKTMKHPLKTSNPNITPPFNANPTKSLDHNSIVSPQVKPTTTQPNVSQTPISPAHILTNLSSAIEFSQKFDSKIPSGQYDPEKCTLSIGNAKFCTIPTCVQNILSPNSSGVLLDDHYEFFHKPKSFLHYCPIQNCPRSHNALLGHQFTTLHDFQRHTASTNHVSIFQLPWYQESIQNRTDFVYFKKQFQLFENAKTSQDNSSNEGTKSRQKISIDQVNDSQKNPKRIDNKTPRNHGNLSLFREWYEKPFSRSSK